MSGELIGRIRPMIIHLSLTHLRTHLLALTHRTVPLRQVKLERSVSNHPFPMGVCALLLGAWPWYFRLGGLSYVAGAEAALGQLAHMAMLPRIDKKRIPTMLPTRLKEPSLNLVIVLHRSLGSPRGCEQCVGQVRSVELDAGNWIAS